MSQWRSGISRQRLLSILHVLTLAAGLFLSTWNACSEETVNLQIAVQGILSSLRTSSGRDLKRCLRSLDEKSRTLPLREADIDAVIAELNRIGESDPYQTEAPTKGNRDPSQPPRLWFPNRNEARSVIPLMQAQKAAIALREPPLPHRLERIFAFIEGRTDLGITASRWFLRELEGVGKDAVPLIIEHTPEDAQFIPGYLSVLSSISDDRAVDYMITTIKILPQNDFMARCDGIKSLSRFQTEPVINFLIDELRNETSYTSDGCGGQSIFGSNDGPCAFTNYPIQHCAGFALIKVTKRDWGPIFCDDYRTWNAWRNFADRTAFGPLMLARSEDELSVLATKLIHREMSNGGVEEYDPEDEGAYRGYPLIGHHLRSLDSYAVSAVLQEFVAHERFIRTDEGREKLRGWARTILEGIGTPDARATAELPELN